MFSLQQNDFCVPCTELVTGDSELDKTVFKAFTHLWGDKQDSGILSVMKMASSEHIP